MVDKPGSSRDESPRPVRRGGEGAGPARGIILVVDDDPISRNIVRDLLGSRGYSVDAVGTAPAALERIRTGRYDLLVLDIFLAGVDGRAVHSAVVSIDPAMAGRTIFMSHWDPTGELGAYVSTHGTVLRKPFTAEELMRSVDSAMTGAGKTPEGSSRR